MSKHIAILLLAVILSVSAVGCGSTEKAVSNTPAATVATTSTTTPKQEQVATKQEEVKIADKLSDDEVKRFGEYSKALRGAPFIKSSRVEGNKAIVEYATYKEYVEKRGNKEGGNTEETYNDYWKTGDTFRKALMEESVRLLREFPELNEVKIVTPPFDGKKYSTTLNRKQAQEFYKVDLSEIHKDSTNELWKQKIVNPYFTKEGRDKFEKEFIKTETP